MPFAPAYHHPATASAAQPNNTTAAQRLHAGIRLILTIALTPALLAELQPPPDLAKRVARRESITQAERNQYTYRQTVVLEELDHKGGRAGTYHEVRDVVFSPAGVRSEQVVEGPIYNLKRLRLTDEDHRDIREVHSIILSEDTMFAYETKYRGVERVDDIECFVLQVRPRQILHGMRFFDGLLWINPADYSIVRMEGQPVPQILRSTQENLFPRFTTLRRPVDRKLWFPAHTHADDTLPFRSGPIRVRLTIRYSAYQRFTAESEVKFGEVK